ncbi:MAG: hypothetical protein ABJB69_02195 [Spartobacteria bacterium]
MLTQRKEGLYRLFLLSQIVIVAILFWLGVWVMVTFYSPGADLTWRRYSIYCGLLVVGMLLESFTREGSKNYFLHNELLRQHRLSRGRPSRASACSCFISSRRRSATRSTRNCRSLLATTVGVVDCRSCAKIDGAWSHLKTSKQRANAFATPSITRPARIPFR